MIVPALVEGLTSALKNYEASTSFALLAALALWFIAGGSPVRVFRHLKQRLDGWRYLVSGANIISSKYMKVIN